MSLTLDKIKPRSGPSWLLAIAISAAALVIAGTYVDRDITVHRAAARNDQASAAMLKSINHDIDVEASRP